MAAAAAPGPARAGFAVVELFTSEGCSSCPPADEALIGLSARASRDGLPLYVLEWHVDYWDYLGWRDPFGSSLASRRQESYARSLASSVYTPEAIINGSVIAGWAGDSAEIERDVRSAAREAAPAGLDLQVQRRAGSPSLVVRVRASGASAGSKVLVALVEEGLGSRPAAGENAGQSLRHSSVVRSVAVLAVPGGEASLAIPPGTDLARASVIGLVQEPTMRIDAAARADLAAGAGARLSGRVTDRAGRAAAGVTVQACSGTVCIPAVTDAAGAFELDGLAPGSWQLVAGPAAAAVTVRLAGGQRLELPAPLVISR